LLVLVACFDPGGQCGKRQQMAAGRGDSPGSTAHGCRGRAEDSCRMRKAVAVKKALLLLSSVSLSVECDQNQRVVAAVPHPIDQVLFLATRLTPSCTDAFVASEPHFAARENPCN